MRSEFRVGRLRGIGANMSLTTAFQLVGGLSVTLDIPKGHVAVVTLHVQFAIPANTTNVATLEVDGLGSLPTVGISNGGPSNAYMMASEAFLLTFGKRALRVLANSSAAAGGLDPTNATMTWVIAPLGGVA